MSRRKDRGLTPHQKRVLEWIKNYVRERGISPSVRDVGNAFNISPPSALAIIKTLEKKGWILREKKTARGIKIIDKIESVPVPLLGEIPAGKPLTVFENIEGYIHLPSDIIKGKEFFALRIKGESMKDAGILPGDIIIVQKQEVADNNDIVVACVDEECTVKRWIVRGKRYFLKPENEGMETMEVTNRECLILGRVKIVLRFY